MFEGYDHERKPPYCQEVYFEHDGKFYKTTYYVCNGYGGSVSITQGKLILVTPEEKNEKSNVRKSR